MTWGPDPRGLPSSIHDGDLHVLPSGYPLVNVYATMERSTMLWVNKSTISTGQFSSSQTVNFYQAGYVEHAVENMVVS